jgi:hypothetical protein
MRKIAVEIKTNKDKFPVCQVCGCDGNCECGHQPPQTTLDNGRGCALNPTFLTCPCCELKQTAVTRK